MPGGLCLHRQTQPFRHCPLWPGVLSLVFAAACPVLCSGNGQYSKGTCQCYSGWKGAECDVPMNQCIDPSCGGHGSCIDGNCVCSAGHKGEHCEEGKCCRARLGSSRGERLLQAQMVAKEPNPRLLILQRKLQHFAQRTSNALALVDFWSCRKHRAVEGFWKECFVYPSLC